MECSGRGLQTGGMSTLLLLLTLVAEPDRGAFQIKSEILGETRRVFVHLPKSFATSAPSRRYPTTIVFDGQFLLKPVVTVSDVLSDEGQIPESVIVAIENLDDYEGRVRDLTPPGLSVSGSDLRQGGDRFLDFVEKELLPALDAQFRTSAPRTLVGTSSGGILATYAAATRDTFRFTLALDTPAHLGEHWLAKKLLQRASAQPSPLHYASIEARFGFNDEQWKRITAAAPPAWSLYREKLTHESHNSMQFLGAYLGLRELFRDYSMLAAPVAPTTSILPSYEKLTASYGARMIPPSALLLQVADDLLMEGRGAAARAAFDTAVAAYGEPHDAAAIRSRIAVVERQPPPAETVEGLLATPFPSVEEARDYIGEWEGEQWINPESKDRAALRLVAEGGRVTGTWISWPEENVELPRKLEYLKVTPQGLTFGFMNGMRPRGMLLYEGRREGGVLAGEMRFGGINFQLPDGHPLPRHLFTLRWKANGSGVSASPPKDPRSDSE